MTKVAGHAAASTARGKLGPKQHVVKPVHHPAPPPAFQHADLAECPLCVEPLDDTDRDFWPCPCGYQVCLFCYQRLQSEYNNTCPGCRQQYSDDLEGVRKHIARKQQQQAAEAAAAAATARPGVSSSHGAGHAHHHHHQGHHGHHGAPAAAPAGGRGKGGAAAKQRQQQQHEPHVTQPRTPGHGSPEANSLPPTATWVAAATVPGAASPAPTGAGEQQQERPQPPPVAAGDESAWPTLGAAQQQQQQHKPDTAPGHERRRSSSSSLTAASPQQQQQQQQQQHTGNGRHDGGSVRSSFESIASTHTSAALAERHQQSHHAHQNQQLDSSTPAGSDAQSPAAARAQQQQQQQGAGLELARSSSGYTTVEVTTVARGKRCSVCVPVSSHEAQQVEAFPEAVSLLSVLQQAVSSSKLTSTEAAVQLVQCLRKLEADSGSNGGSSSRGWIQQVLSSDRNGASQPSPARLLAAPRAPPPGFGHTAAAAAFRSATAQQQQQQGDTPQGSMHSVDSTSSLFSQVSSSLSQSVWTDSGLPGVDLGVGVTRLAGGLSGGVPARLQAHWAGINGGSTAAAAGPPPGFGPAAAGGAGGGGAAAAGYGQLSSEEAAVQQQLGGISLPPGFGLAALKQQQQQQQPALYRPFS